LPPVHVVPAGREETICCVEADAVCTAIPFWVMVTFPGKELPLPVVSSAAVIREEPSDPGSKLLAVTVKLPVASAGTAVELSMVAATLVEPQSLPATTR